MYYEDVFLEFNNKKVRYLVVGGVAVNLYGVPRMTMDLDLMVEMSKNNLLNLIGVLENLGYKPKVPVRATDFVDPEKRIRWQKEKNMVVFTFTHSHLPYQQVDIFLVNPIDFEEAYSAKKVIIARDTKIPLLSIDHLISLKKELGREQDLSDVEALEKIKEILKKGKRKKE